MSCILSIFGIWKTSLRRNLEQITNNKSSQQHTGLFGYFFLQCSPPGPVLGKSSWWFNCHSWAAKSLVKGSVPAEWWAFLRPRRVGKKGLCSGLPTPPACFWALWKWGHSKQTIRLVEWIMMHMFTEWDFCSTFSVHSAKKEEAHRKRGVQFPAAELLFVLLKRKGEL